MRWQVDHRWTAGSTADGWCHSLTTVNVVHDPPADAEIFLGTPTRYVDERTHLS
ncbi:hypothetical protein [Lentzea sp. CA-135723]|uniref:hypothetical protein n=1 Tax=Lentzea sp. CA-135723 TaxID=3239950 RepID=UPI003D89F847